jgi:signal transduction histidine kinase
MIDGPQAVPEPTLSFFQTLRFRLILSVALVHAILMGAFVWSAVAKQSEDIRAELINRAHSLTALMAVASTNALLAEDLGSLAEITGRVKRQPDVIYGAIVDVRGDVLASTDPRQVGHPIDLAALHRGWGRHVLDLRDTIRVAGRRVGTVLLGMSTRALHAHLAQTRDRGVLFILLAIIAGSLAAGLLSYVITRNLYALMAAVREIGGGHLSARVKIGARDEVGLLAGAFNAMARSLEETSLQARKEHEKRTDAERLACVGELSASIAHEIRNPLSAVINSVKLLGHPGLTTEDRGQAIAIVNTESQRLQRILNDFLDFSRIRETRMVEDDICALIEEVARLIQGDLQERSVRIQVQSALHPCRTRHDPDQMRQVIWNLILNSVQAMPEGGDITARLMRVGATVRVSIADTGCGIPDHLLERIVRPFVTGRKQGTGLGLSIVQRILMQHGTRLDVVSHVGAGTEVSFTLEAP